ncbi:hypothetical protein [Demequina rhizosphaerae]|uniref:hypothetical protein n=1 Tax=Demequina rhizosphaerae TaxID=1638985 RepID=UPI000781573D|nr:hypothetical protein [Demequina rhizosphaerae]
MSGAVRLQDDAVVRSQFDDALERDGEMLVLVGNDVSLLSAVAAEVVRAARRGISVGALKRHLLGEFGEPADGDAGVAVRELVAALTGRGVLRVEAGP